MAFTRSLTAMALSTLVVAAGIRLSVHFSLALTDGEFAFRLAILLVFLVGLYLFLAAHTANHFTGLINKGMRFTALFALGFSMFTLAFYRLVAPEYFEQKIADRMNAAAGQPAETVEQVRATAELVFSPFAHSTLTLAGLLITGFFYSLVMAALLRLYAHYSSQR